jgi:hypothetical protein
MLKSVFAALMVITATHALADPAVELLRATADNKKSKDLVYRYELITDGGRLDTLVYYNFDDETRAPKVDYFNGAQLRAGVAVVKREKRDIVILSAPDINAESGGQVILDFLNNGVTGKRLKDYYWISRNAKGDWEFSQNGRTIKELFFRTNKVLGKEVGISRIEIVR